MSWSVARPSSCLAMMSVDTGARVRPKASWLADMSQQHTCCASPPGGWQESAAKPVSSQAEQLPGHDGCLAMMAAENGARVRSEPSWLADMSQPRNVPPQHTAAGLKAWQNSAAQLVNGQAKQLPGHI